MKDLLVVYYSRTGTARRVAETLAHVGQGHIGQVLDQRARAGWIGDLRCVLDQVLQRRPAVRYNGPNPSRFRHIILVAPVWLQRLAAPMTSFLHQTRLPAVKIACVSVMAKEGGFQAIQEISRLVPSPLSDELVLLEAAVLNGQATAKLERFVGDFLADHEQTAQRPLELSPNAT